MNVNIYKSSEECNSRLAEYLIENYLSKIKILLYQVVQHLLGYLMKF